MIKKKLKLRKKNYYKISKKKNELSESENLLNDYEKIYYFSGKKNVITAHEEKY